MIRASNQFKAVQTPSGKKAFEAFCAVWDNDGKNIAICAPTLEALEEAWKQITFQDLIKDQTQQVWIVKAANG